MDPLNSRLHALLQADKWVRLGVLYGSRARRRARPDSDIDLVVASSPGAGDQLERVAGTLQMATDLGVSLLQVDRAFERAPSLLLDALHEGIVLVDRDRVWPQWLAREAEVAARASEEQARLREQAAEALRVLAGVDPRPGLAEQPGVISRKAWHRLGLLNTRLGALRHTRDSFPGGFTVPALAAAAASDEPSLRVPHTLIEQGLRHAAAPLCDLVRLAHQRAVDQGDAANEEVGSSWEWIARAGASEHVIAPLARACAVAERVGASGPVSPWALRSATLAVIDGTGRFLGAWWLVWTDLGEWHRNQSGKTGHGEPPR
jgi:predicted nucleotidyltransferase